MSRLARDEVHEYGNLPKLGSALDRGCGFSNHFSLSRSCEAMSRRKRNQRRLRVADTCS